MPMCLVLSVFFSLFVCSSMSLGGAVPDPEGCHRSPSRKLIKWRQKSRHEESESEREEREKETFVLGCCVGCVLRGCLRCFVFDRLCVNSVSVHGDCAGRG